MINCAECDGSGIVETVLKDGFTSFGTCLTCQRRNMADDYPRIAEENRTLKQQNEQMKQAFKVIHGIASETFESPNQLELIRLTAIEYFPKEGEQT